MTVAACAENVRKGDPDRFLATMAGPRSAREQLFPLYAFNLEVARAPWVTQEPLIAEMRLQWWHDVLTEIETGQKVRSHEVATPLGDVISPDQARVLKAVVDARKWDIQRDGFQSVDALKSHIDQTSGLLAAVATEILGGSHDRGRALGNAQGAAAWLRAVPDLYSNNRQPLPGDMIETVALIARFGLEEYAASHNGTDPVPKSVLPALWVGFDAPVFLARAKAAPARVLSSEITVSEFRRKSRLLRLTIFNSW